MKTRVYLIAAFISALAAGGCVVLPNPANMLPYRNPLDGKIGEADSAAPIKKSISDRSDVIKTLGQPEGIGEDPAFWSYGQSRITGVWIWLWPFVHNGPIQLHREGSLLTIHFGTNGRVDSYEMLRD